MNLIRCENGHYYDGDRYASCPHCGSAEPVYRNPYHENAEPTCGNRPLSEAFICGCGSLWKWLLFTVLVSGIPMMLYVSLTLFFEPPLDSGLTEMTALFFGITAPVVLDQEQKLDYKNNLLNEWARFFCSLLFVFLCLYYGYIYIRLFHGGVLSEEEIGAYNTIVWFLGIICCILVAGSRFVEGFVDDAE